MRRHFCAMAIVTCLHAASASLGAQASSLGPLDQPVGFRVIEVPSIDHSGRPTTIDVALFYPTANHPSPDRYLLDSKEISTVIARDGAFAPNASALIVFSHGAGGSGVSATYLCESLARSGFVVAAIDHTDQVRCASARGLPSRCRAFQLLRYALQVRNTIASGTLRSLTRYDYRPAQVRDTVDHLLRESTTESSPLAGIVTDRVGLIGHSFGAWTTMIVAGLVAKERHPKVRAAVSLSGVTVPTTFADNELAGLRTPVMIQAGSKEHPYDIYKKRQYDRFHPPKVLVQILDAGHSTFAAGRAMPKDSTAAFLADPPRRAIVETAVDFLRAFVVDDPEARQRLAAADYEGIGRMSLDLGDGPWDTADMDRPDTGGWHLDEKFRYGAQDRTYHFFEAAEHQHQPRPLVILLHGGGAVIRNHLGDHARPCPFREWFTIAEEERLHLLVPQGRNRQWNDCRSDCRHCGTQDDVGFLLALVDALSERYGIDPTRIYSVGESNGGLMTLRLAVERPDRFAAVGAVTALMPANSECTSGSAAISIQFQVGTEDMAIPYAGGRSASNWTGAFWSAEKTTAHWVARNRCDPKPTSTKIADSPFPDQSTVVLESYASPATGTAVQVYHIEGGGHVPPSGNIQVSRLWEAIAGKQNHDIEGARVLWDFFQLQWEQRERELEQPASAGGGSPL